jgi:hypothetical protein
MDINQQINLEHLLFVDRRCRTCQITKNLLSDYYLTRKDRGSYPSSYSYECKSCTIQRVVRSRRHDVHVDSNYPDW